MYTLIGPWPPQRSVAARVARDLVRYGGEIAGVATLAPDPECTGEAFLLDPDDPRRWPGDRRLYHFDDHADHAFAVELFLRTPGVVALHAPALHTLAQAADVYLPGFSDRQLGGVAGADPARLRAMWRDGLRRRSDAFDLPCLGWLADAATIIVPSHAVRRRVAAALPGLPLHVIAHPIPLLGREEGAARRRHARDGFGLEHKAFVVAVPGRPLQAEVTELIAALASLAGQGRPLGLVLAGRLRVGEIEEQARAAGVGVRWAAPGDFDEAAIAADMLVVGIDPDEAGLRAVHIAQAHGVVVVSVGALFADDVPESCCIGIDGVGRLARVIAEFNADSDALRALRAAGRALVDAVAKPSMVARAYLEVVHAA